MTDAPDSVLSTREARQQQKEIRSYVLGGCLSLFLTLAPFAAVLWRATSHTGLLVLIGCCCLLQIVVHLRCFLHIGFEHQREDLQLILFSALLLLIMVAGTLWIMGDLSQRMGMGMGLPGSS